MQEATKRWTKEPLNLDWVMSNVLVNMAFLFTVTSVSGADVGCFLKGKPASTSEVQ